MTSRWPRDTYARAVWASELRPFERLVALCYANWAKDQHTSWVTYDHIIRDTGMSRDAISRAIRGLLDSGWLCVIGPVVADTGSSKRSPIRYRLTIPSTGDGPVTSTGDGPAPVRETDSTSTGDGRNYSPTTHQGGGTPDPTHGNRHQPGNPEDKPCRRCKEERENTDMTKRQEQLEALAAEINARKCPHGVINGAVLATDGTSTNGCLECEGARAAS